MKTRLPTTPLPNRVPLWLTLAALAIGTGCRVVQSAADIPGQTVRAVTPGKEKHAVDIVDVQQNLMRFTDEFATGMVTSVDRLRRGTNTLAATEALRWKIALTMATSSIVSGPNPVADLLDMTVFVTVTRMALEEQWMPHDFGDSALPMLEICRNAETNIWMLTGRVLSPKQQDELRAAIDEWRRRRPLPESLLAARAVGFASQLAAAKKSDQEKSDSLFAVIGLNPLAGLDPAAREIAQTRLFAERALYVSQKMPLLLRWQTELLSENAVQLPAVQQLVTNSTQIASSADRFARVAEQLPGQISNERRQILEALEAQEKGATSLLATGTRMSDSLNTTLTTFDALMQRFGVGETNQSSASSTNAEPFRIQDYAATAAQLEKAITPRTKLFILDHRLNQPCATLRANHPGG